MASTSAQREPASERGSLRHAGERLAGRPVGHDGWRLGRWPGCSEPVVAARRAGDHRFTLSASRSAAWPPRLTRTLSLRPLVSLLWAVRVRAVEDRAASRGPRELTFDLPLAAVTGPHDARYVTNGSVRAARPGRSPCARSDSLAPTRRAPLRMTQARARRKRAGPLPLAEVMRECAGRSTRPQNALSRPCRRLVAPVFARVGRRGRTGFSGHVSRPTEDRWRSMVTRTAGCGVIARSPFS
jgi:hypothetical protein